MPEHVAPTNGPIGWVVFLLVLGGFLYLIYRRVAPLVRLIRQGKPENRTDDIGQRVWFFISNYLLQRRLFRKPIPGTVHALLFWGFMILQIGVAYSIFYGLIPVEIPIISSRPMATLVDLFIVVIFLTTVYFGIRRAFIKPGYLTITRDGWIVITFINLSILTELLIEAFAWRAAPSVGTGYPPLGRRLGEWLIPASAGWPTPTEAPVDVRQMALLLWQIAWWAKVFVILTFLVYIPTSKHLHIFTAIFNTFFQNTKPKGALKKIENIEEAEHYGANKFEDFTWKDLLDTAVCTECGRCTQVCPANATGKPLNPKKIIIDIKTELFARSHIPLTGHSVGVGGTRNDQGENLDDTPQLRPAEVESLDITAGAADSGAGGSRSIVLPPLVRGMITEDELWSCTTCRACMTECPVFIEHVPKIVDMRRFLVLEESEFPPEVVPLFNNLERNGNPWQMRPEERMEWTTKMPFEVKVLGELDEGAEVDVLFWVGCMGSLDQRNKKVTQNLASILEEAGLNWAILGPEESCSGDPARRIGNEYLYQMLAEQNIETINGYKEAVKLKKVVTACPHCFNTLKNEYPQFNGHFEVVHHTQLISKLIEEGKIKPSDGLAGKKLTYHDPCYLGRYNDVYDAPRFVLNSLGNGLKKIDFVEMPRNKSKSFCCGGGGGRAWMEEKIGSRVNQTRVQEAADTGAEVVAAGCPFCITMFEDGIKGKGLEDKLKVLDITELVQLSRQTAPVSSTSTEQTTEE
jgi:Fe-S oxidoreductase